MAKDKSWELVNLLAEKLQEKDYIKLDPEIIAGYYEKNYKNYLFFLNKTTKKSIYPNLSEFRDEKSTRNLFDFNNMRIVDVSKAFPLYNPKTTFYLEDPTYRNTIRFSGYRLPEWKIFDYCLLKDLDFKNCNIILNCAGYLDNESEVLRVLRKSNVKTGKIFAVDINDKALEVGLKCYSLENDVMPLKADVLSEELLESVKALKLSGKTVSMLLGNSLANFSGEELNRLLTMQNRLLKENDGSLIIGTRFIANQEEDIEKHISYYTNRSAAATFKIKWFDMADEYIANVLSHPNKIPLRPPLHFLTAYLPKEKEIVSGVLSTKHNFFAILNRSKVSALHGEGGILKKIEEKFEVREVYQTEDISYISQASQFPQKVKDMAFKSLKKDEEQKNDFGEFINLIIYTHYISDHFGIEREETRMFDKKSLANIIQKDSLALPKYALIHCTPK